MKYLKIKVLLGTVLIVFLLQGCSFLYGEPSPPQSSSIINVTETDTEMWMSSISGVNQFNEEWATEDMEGQWWIAKTIFTRCPTVCLTMTPNMSQLQQEIADEELDIKIISFTVDPEFDEPERLENYGENYEANFENWSFITGYSFEDIQEMVLESFRLPVTKDPERNDISHPTRFFVVNPEGEIVRLYSGERDFDPDNYVKDLKILLNE
ncbi:SCO family protein [Evansella sp. AB-P1]|uniref:SCO family protein n=1 Tax=Evansella sp. AB-P1 TaxID=3037653 RepID=UPI00241CA9E3|nr:SCO family protein [Evansella sp. AB-P1]MDG5789179.1 SCO family protein [Evansella sp. AB-P1]